MRSDRSRAAITLAAAGAAAWALATGCALFTDLSSDHYALADGGEGGTCTGDAMCTTLAIVCSHDCPSGEVCCLTPNSSGTLSPACLTAAACTSQSSLSFPLCSSTGQCEEGGACIAQTCNFGGQSYTVSACTTIPTSACKTP